MTEVLVTPDHLFYINGKGWVRAGYISIGDEIILASQVTTKVTSISISLVILPVTVYNIEVEGTHTYYVTELQMLVHNDCK